MQRPLRYDGLLPTIVRADGSLAAATVADVQAIKQFSDEQRSDKQTPFDIVVEGVTPIDAPKQAPSIVAPFAQAGATWWIELMWDVPGGMDAVLTSHQARPAAYLKNLTHPFSLMPFSHVSESAWGADRFPNNSRASHG